MENNFNCWFQSIDDPNNKFPIDEIIPRPLHDICFADNSS